MISGSGLVISTSLELRFHRTRIFTEQTLYRVSKSILINDVDCEDAVQEAVLKAYLKRNSLREEKYFKTWLIRILINKCYQLLRTKKQELSYPLLISGIDYTDGTGISEENGLMSEEFNEDYIAVGKFTNAIELDKVKSILLNDNKAEVAIK